MDTLASIAVGDVDYTSKTEVNREILQTWSGVIESSKEDKTAKNAPSGYAGLDADGHLVLGELPPTVELTTHKGAANGYPSLGADGLVPISQLPIAVQEAAGGAGIDLTSYQLKSAKDQPSGYPSLDGSGKVPSAEIPDLSATYIAITQKGANSGVASLDSGGHVPDAQIPAAIARDSEVTAAISAALSGYSPDLSAYETTSHAASTYETAAHAASTYAPIAQPVNAIGGVAGKPGAGAVLLWYLPSFTVTIPAGLTATRCKIGANPTATAVLSVQKNGVEFGTISISTSGVVTLASASGATITNADELTVVAPGSQDTTLSDVRVTITGTR